MASRPRIADASRASPSPTPDRTGTGPRSGRLVGEVEADQRDEEPVAVVLVGRPDVDEVAQVRPEDQAEQPQAARPAEAGAILGLCDHPAYAALTRAGTFRSFAGHRSEVRGVVDIAGLP